MAARSGRQGKIVTAGHSARIEGLSKFLTDLEEWSEIATIRIGSIRVGGVAGQQHNAVQPTRQQPKGKGLGGAFSFRVTRWARVGELITGIKCIASHGRSHQEVVLTSAHYPALRARLAREGYLTDD